jgi:hypothetical protein
MAPLRAPIQSCRSRKAPFCAVNRHIYLAREMFYTPRWLMGGGDASVVVRGPGERGFRQDYSDITQALPTYFTPNLGCNDFATLT